MGNRAIITTKENYENNGVGIYVHWNGSKESVQKWLDICAEKHYRKPEDDSYGFAWLIYEIAKYFDEIGNSGLSVGIDKVHNFGIEDNGIWIIEDWKIVDNKKYKI